MSSIHKDSKKYLKEIPDIDRNISKNFRPSARAINVIHINFNRKHIIVNLNTKDQLQVILKIFKVIRTREMKI